MSNDQMQEIIDLQRYKLKAQQEKFDAHLEECAVIFNLIMDELNVSQFSVDKHILIMQPQNLNAMLHQIKMGKSTKNW